MTVITIRLPIIASVGKEKPADEVFGDSVVVPDDFEEESMSG